MTSFDPAIQQQITASGIIAVLVIDDASDAVPLAKSLIDGGITAMELTLRTPAALDALRAIRAEVPQMLAGVGTVLTPQQVRDSKTAGASFAVAPGFNPRVVTAAQDANLSFAPGIFTPTDIEAALELHCRLLKFFPAETGGGLKHLEAMANPYQHLHLQYIPLGGLTAQNMNTYLASPLIPAIGGSWIAKRELIAAKNWSAITANARQARTQIDQLRSKTNNN